MIGLAPDSFSRDADTSLFSPIRLEVDEVSTDKLLACYRFINLFLHGAGHGLVKALLDMEVNSERLVANCSPRKREELIESLQGLSMNMQFVIRDEERRLVEVSIHIVPSEVLTRAQQGIATPPSQHHLWHDLERLIPRLIAKEIRRRFTAKLAEVFRALANIQQLPSLIEHLLATHRIDRNGTLLQAACIDDLLTGKYRDQFERVIPKELLEEGLSICETIDACSALEQPDTHLPTPTVGTHFFLRNISIQQK